MRAMIMVLMKIMRVANIGGDMMAVVMVVLLVVAMVIMVVVEMEIMLVAMQ